MSGDVGSASHFNRLMEIARQYRVKVHFLERSVASEVDWDGLYLVTPPVPMIYETTSLLRLVWGRGGFDG